MSKAALLGIVFLTVLLSFMIWKGYLELPGTNVNIDLAIPENADYSFKIDNISGVLSLLKKSKYKDDLKKDSWYINLINGLKLIQALEADNADNSLQIMAAYQQLEEVKGDFLFCVSGKNIPKQPFKFFRKIIKNNEEVVETNKVGNTIMYSANVTSYNISNLTFASRKGIILFSRNPQLVEESLNKLNGISTNFSRSYTKSNASIKTTQTGLKINFTDNISKGFMLGSFPELSQLDAKLYLFDNAIISNGELKVKQHSRLSILSKHTIDDFGKILEFVPANVDYFEKYKVNNLLGYIEHQLENESDELSNINFSSNLGNEWVSLKYSQGSLSNFIFIIEDANQLAEYLNIENDELRKFEYVAFLKALGFINDLTQSYYYHIYNNALIIGSNKKEINALVDDIKQKESFLLNKNFRQYESKLYKNNFCLVFSKAINTRVKNSFGPAFYQFFTIDDAIFSNTVFGYNNEGLTNKVNFEYKPVVKPIKNSNQLNKWEIVVGQKVENGPDEFKNHYTNELEFIVQDDQNNLYLIDKKDSIIWTKKLDGNYLGKINIVDFYDNNKFQMLLNTENAIYLIDRKGRDVNGFPVELTNGATNGLTLVTYSDAKKTRYYFANNKHILQAYDENAKPVKGWKLPQLLSEVTLPIKHFVANNKDYLCAVNKKGTVNLFSRDGTLRQASFETNLEDINHIKLITENGEKAIEVSNNKNSKKIILQ